MTEIKFDAAAGIISLVGSDPEREKVLDRDHERVPGTLSWKVREPGRIEKAKSLIAAVLSGGASPEVVAVRRLSCFGDATRPACPAMVVDGDGKYCGTCRCSRWKLADLDGSLFPKLGWKNLECPLRRPGFSNSSS